MDDRVMIMLLFLSITPSTLSVPFRVSEVLLVVSVILFFLSLSTIKSPPFSIFRVSIGIYVMIDGLYCSFQGGRSWHQSGFEVVGV